MKRLSFGSLITLAFLFTLSFNSSAQIYEPEGLNMPGLWNSWTNPPANNLVLANPNQVPGGLLTKHSNGVNSWHTLIHVAAAGGDMVGGTYQWIFTSGPETNYFANKWSSVVINIDELQNYTYQGADDNEVTLINDYWYTVVWEDLGYMDSRGVFMETSAEPVDIISVSEPTGVVENEIVDVDFVISTNPCAEEVFYLQYTTDGWTSSHIVGANMSGVNGSTSIPGQAESTLVEYNVFSSSVPAITTDGFLYAMKMNDDGGLNYSYAVGTPLPDTIGWANLQWPPSGEILPSEEYIVYGRAFIYNITEQADSLTDLQAWIGFSTDNTDPNTWTDWIPAYYFGPAGDNDEFSADLGSFMNTEGIYYYATRFQYQSQDYEYGGYSDGGGDFWDGVDFISGVLTVTNDPTPDVIGWANLQWPASGEIEPEDEFIVYGQAWIDGVTNQADSLTDLFAWIGYSTDDSNPETWTNWIPAYYLGVDGDNDEYTADLGSFMDQEGSFYYATRFKYQGQDYVYGGYSDDGGNFWNGTDYVSGVLTVVPPTPDVIGWANLQWPPSGEILPEEEFIVYAQAWIDGVTSQSDSLLDLEAWIGVHTADTDPETWTNWIPAYYLAEDGDNDEYAADLGSIMDQIGTYYYATRFKYQDQDFVFGGYSDAGGGFWDGTDNVSGILTVTNSPAPDTIGWANLQWPPTGAIEPEQEFIVYAQAWIDGITGSGDVTDELEAWIGVSENDTDPSTWTNWQIADFEGADGGNDEFITDIGSGIIAEGTYYYATRFKYPDQEYVYGGYSDNGGGFWDGSDNVSGVLTVTESLIAYPVNFTVTDATGLYSNIKLKGDMTDWNPVDMLQDGQDWMLSLDIFPGAYEWGVLEDDGSPNGIWLVIGDNLVVNIDNEGIISGDTIYVVTFVGIDEMSTPIGMYPNPVKDKLWIEKDSDGKIDIQLLDATGSLIKMMNYSSSKIEIDLSFLSSGLYFLQLQEGDQVQMLKFIKQ